MMEYVHAVNVIADCLVELQNFKGSRFQRWGDEKRNERFVIFKDDLIQVLVRTLTRD